MRTPIAIMCSLLLTGACTAAQRNDEAKQSGLSATVPEPDFTPGYNEERNAYFGDLHVHTNLSFDAYIFNVRQTPDDAYRFAKGRAIGHAAGFKVRLAGEALDFAAVTDHAEFMGVMREAEKPENPLSKVPWVQGLMTSDRQSIAAAFREYVKAVTTNTLPAGFRDPDTLARAWIEVKEAAENNNQPGKFTTFVGYEYTATPAGQNLHRNVIFDGSRVASPFTASDSDDPESLWRAMDRWREQGIESLAIPHNSNGSDGLMFDGLRMNGKPMDSDYASLRMRNEPLVEITQIKGTSETHPALSPNDEWSGFEIMDHYIGSDQRVTKFAGSYVRQALLDGILHMEERGFNPFKYGFIGSSDTHNAAPGSVEEANYFSKVGVIDGGASDRGSVPPDGARTWVGASDAAFDRTGRYSSWGASGLVGVWAEQNTRTSIFAALRRKETFATSGPRIKLRFFAGYDLPADIFSRANPVRLAYTRGVAMGSDLPSSRGRVPQFMIWALRDPRGGYLQRAQIVKGWVEDGVAKEQVFDVVCSDGLTVNPTTQRCPDNGASVNLKNCEPDRFKGDTELRTIWQDPNFDRDQRAFYYARVLENPSCRWSTWDALRNGTEPSPKRPQTIMERAWSSPIWLEPLN